MTGMWLFLKENVKCGSKLSDVLCTPERCSNKKPLSSEENILNSHIVHPLATPIRELIFRQDYSQTRLYELEIGNPSRKIVEIIFRKALVDPSQTEIRIKSVLKVVNSIQSLERFENYREKVKTMAYYRYTKHPRNVVDGNELLRFYGTMMACRSARPKRLSKLCKNPTCRVCRILQSNFGVEHGLVGGIRLSSCSEDFSENTVPIMKMKSTERAVIVCRAIAGSSSSVNDGVCDEFGSDRCETPCYNSGNAIVCNPSAVLPCFVIVFN